MDDEMTTLETRRLEVSRTLDREYRSTFGQFFTPAPIARFMASLFSFPRSGTIHLLDPGAGIGSLTAAILERNKTRNVAVSCYEIEPKFEHSLRKTLASYSRASFTVHQTDFIESAVKLVAGGKIPGFDAAILNPPYRKIAIDSAHRLLTRKLGTEVSNLYTSFLVCTIALCRPGAQVVAIIPRSFMNGVYFKPFRYWLLAHAAITRIHIFDSRDLAFADDNVLQENVIVRLVVGGKQGPVEISSSHDHSFANLQTRICPFDEIVTSNDEEKFIHVPAPGNTNSYNLPGVTLRELGLDVCTGPVVDFRMSDYLRLHSERGTVPLLYATHFANGQLEWPKESRKPNAIVRNSLTERWLMPNGCYVLTRRFTSKEEKRRVVAYVLNKGALPGKLVGFENHLNVIHKNKNGLQLNVALGLAKYLNSKMVDNYFRTFSGHTQVNATDLRRLKYPSIKELAKLGSKK
ncbi:MAG: Eco57I restriction-modification methylase domain-containing protein [Pseudomonadota bacterium]